MLGSAVPSAARTSAAGAGAGRNATSTCGCADGARRGRLCGRRGREEGERRTRRHGREQARREAGPDEHRAYSDRTPRVRMHEAARAVGSGRCHVPEPAPPSPPASTPTRPSRTCARPTPCSPASSTGTRSRSSRDRDRDGDHYAALIRAIVGQQLSTTVARVMWGRMLERFDGRPPTPQEVLDDDPEELRAAIGLSRAKVSFLRSLAEHIQSGELDLDHVSTLPDDELIRELTAVKGIGDWSAHMFLMFQLQRPDVLAWGDLGVRRGAQLAYGLPELPHRTELELLAEPWRPYRTAACRVLWWSLDNEPS